MIERYRRHLQERNFNPRTIRCNSREFLGLHRFVKGQFSEESILGYYAFLQQNYSASSAYDKLRKGLTVFRWLVKQDLLPPVHLDLKVPEPALIAVLSKTEVAAMLEQLDGKELVMLETLYGCGLRIGELTQLTVHSLCFDPPQIRIAKAKGGSFRVVPMGDHLAGILKKYVATLQKPSLFGSMDVYAIVHRVALAAGVTKRVTPHSFRHAFATHLLLNGAAMVHVARLLGHQHVQSTARYTHLQPMDLATELRRCHPRGRRKA